jgi:hypothetical protein
MCERLSAVMSPSAGTRFAAPAFTWSVIFVSHNDPSVKGSIIQGSNLNALQLLLSIE